MTKRNTAQRDRDRAAIKRAARACGICGQPIDFTLPYLHPGEYVVDHVIPLAHGGPDHISNKQPAHRACNRTKSSHTDGGPILRRSNSLTRPQGEAPLPPPPPAPPA